MKTMKKGLITAMFLFSITAFAQVTSVSLQASGLTCSMCSNAINKSLQSLSFVEQVTANISNSTFDILLKPGSQVDFDQLKKKVEDAGFFVANLAATFECNNVSIENDSHTVINGMTFHFLHSTDQILNGIRTMRLLDKGFVTAREYKKNGQFTLMECYKTGKAGRCCTKDGLAIGARVFHVTI